MSGSPEIGALLLSDFVHVHRTRTSTVLLYSDFVHTSNHVTISCGDYSEWLHSVRWVSKVKVTTFDIDKIFYRIPLISIQICKTLGYQNMIMCIRNKMHCCHTHPLE